MRHEAPFYTNIHYLTIMVLFKFLPEYIRGNYPWIHGYLVAEFQSDCAS